MPAAIRFHRTGGPEVLCLEEVEIGAPAPGEATRLKIIAKKKLTGGY